MGPLSPQPSGPVEQPQTQPDCPGFTGKPTEQCEDDGAPRSGDQEAVGPDISPGKVEDPIAAALEGKINVIDLSDVEPEEVSWLWPGYIPRGKLTLIVGDPKTGKSYLTHDLIARLTSGKDWPDNTPAVPPAHVLLLQSEDGLADTVRPRLDALGGDASRVRVLGDVPEGNGHERLFSLEQDLDKIKPVLVKGLAELLVIDPLSAYLGRKIDSYKDADVRRVLAPLAKLADETGAAVIAVMHLTKNSERQALYRPGGSIAFVATARMILVVAKDPEDYRRRLLFVIGSNLGRESDALAFRISDSGVEWDGPTEVDVEAVLGAAAARPSERPAVRLDEAVAFLKGELANGPRPVDEVKKLASARGHKPTTLEKAKRQLGVQTSVRPGGGWLWSLPPVVKSVPPGREKEKDSFFSSEEL